MNKNTETQKLAPEELQKLIAKYTEITKDITDGEALEMLDLPERADYLLLLQIADADADIVEFGKSKAILTAFKLGYMAAKKKFMFDSSDIDIAMSKARTALRATLEGYDLYNTELGMVPGQSEKICEMLEIVDDYILKALTLVNGGAAE